MGYIIHISTFFRPKENEAINEWVNSKVWLSNEYDFLKIIMWWNFMNILSNKIYFFLKKYPLILIYVYKINFKSFWFYIRIYFSKYASKLISDVYEIPVKFITVF